jgi:hypothetical protein
MLFTMAAQQQMPRMSRATAASVRFKTVRYDHLNILELHFWLFARLSGTTPLTSSASI